MSALEKTGGVEGEGETRAKGRDEGNEEGKGMGREGLPVAHDHQTTSAHSTSPASVQTELNRQQQKRRKRFTLSFMCVLLSRFGKVTDAEQVNRQRSEYIFIFLHYSCIQTSSVISLRVCYMESCLGFHCEKLADCQHIISGALFGLCIYSVSGTEELS